MLPLKENEIELDRSEDDNASDQTNDVRIFQFRCFFIGFFVFFGSQAGQVFALLSGDVVLCEHARQEDEDVDDG